MNWIAINNNPEGFESSYIVIEKQTGRDIAINLEKDEALLIENVREIYEYSKKVKDYLNEYYMNDNSSSKEKLREININLTKLEIVLSKINDQ
jgi:hypothetical protein